MQVHGGRQLVGRLKERARLDDALSTASEGRPNLVLVSGEVGVGKTSLVEDFARASGATTLTGRCVPVAGTALPFTPFAQALRPLAASGMPWPADLAPLAPEGTNLRDGPGHREPAQGQISPDGSSRQAPPPYASSGPGSTPRGAGQRRSVLDEPVSQSAQVRLFEAVLTLLTRLSSTQPPVLLVIEDLHWADRSTLDLLAFLANNFTDQPLLLVLTHRTHEVDESGSLAPWLAEMGRLPTTSRLPLHRLGLDDTERLVAAVCGAPPSVELVQTVYSRANGNPLFVEHLLAVADNHDQTVPATLRELLAARVSGLPRDTRRLLRALAVLGPVADPEQLVTMLGAEPYEVEEMLRPAVEAFVVEATADGRLGFRHLLFGEVVYDELLPTEKTRLHKAAAEILSGATSRPSLEAATASQVARHWRAAGDVPRAMRGAVDAGLAATDVFAFADALDCFRQALEMWDQVPPEETADLPLDRVELLAQAAQAASLVGEAPEAIRRAEQALSLTSDAHRTAQLHERLGAFHFIAGHGTEAADAYRAAIAVVPETDTELQARAYSGLALLSAVWGWLDEAVVAAERAQTAAAAAGARREEGTALNALGVVAAFRGDLHRGLELMREALSIATEVDNPDDLAVAYVNLAHLLGMAGDLSGAVDLCREGYAVMTRVGLVRQYGSLLLGNATESLVKSGRLAEAEDTVGEGLRQQPRGMQGAALQMQAARLSLVRGDLDVAWERLEQARLRLEDGDAPDPWWRELQEILAELELWDGRPAAAHEAVMEGLRLLGPDEERWVGGQLAILGARAIADEADLGATPGGPDQGDVIRRREELLAGIEGLLGQRGPTVDTAVQDTTTQAELARLAGSADAAERWVGVAEDWRKLARPFNGAYCEWRAGEAHLRAGDVSAAVDVLRSAHATATQLGAARLTTELEAMARWYRIDPFVAQQRLPEQRTAESVEETLAELGLTPREQEVLVALAAGRTNGEIAKELFISVKTASVHVSNILRKLDVSGRQEAARVAHRLGIGE